MLLFSPNCSAVPKLTKNTLGFSPWGMFFDTVSSASHFIGLFRGCEFAAVSTPPFKILRYIAMDAHVRAVPPESTPQAEIDARSFRNCTINNNQNNLRIIRSLRHNPMQNQCVFKENG
jgi:hypothetical protein